MPCDAAGGGQAVELGQRRDVGRLVEHHQQRWVEPAARPGGGRESVRQDLLRQGREVAAQPPLVVGRRAQVQRVCAAEELVRLEGRARTAPICAALMNERRQHCLRSRVDGAARPLVAAPGGAGGFQRVGWRGTLEDAGDLADLLRIDPADDVGHTASIERSGQEQRRQQLGRRGVPELPVRRRAVRLGRVAEVRRRPASLGPVDATRQGRPGAGRSAGAASRIDAPHAARAACTSRGCGATGRS